MRPIVRDLSVDDINKVLQDWIIGCLTVSLDNNVSPEATAVVRVDHDWQAVDIHDSAKLIKRSKSVAQVFIHSVDVGFKIGLYETLGYPLWTRQ